MPSKNSLKIYVNDGYYHIYNRGVEKRIIFEEAQDYEVFIRYLEETLSPVDINKQNTIFSLRGQSFKAVKRLVKNYYKEIELIAYCLMPNHFHLVIKQKDKNSLTGFMRTLMTRYSMYFNKKYKRVGSLFQGRYKAVLVDQDVYLLHLTRYIHLNPLEFTNTLINAYSSYAEYLGIRKTHWINTFPVISFFSKDIEPGLKKINSYKDFVEKYDKDSKIILEGITLE